MENVLRTLRRHLARCAVRRRRERLGRTTAVQSRMQSPDRWNSTVLSYDSFR